MKEGKKARVWFEYENWTQKFNMICEKADQRASILSLFMFFSTGLCALSLLFPDIIGRKLTLRITSIIMLAAVLCLNFFEDFASKVILIGIAGASGIFSPSIFSIIFAETICKF